MYLSLLTQARLFSIDYRIHFFFAYMVTQLFANLI